MEAATGYCTTGGECRGYGELPYAGHFWPEEEPELRAAADDNVARMKRQAAEEQRGSEPEGKPLSDAELDAQGRKP
jgi:hypothetical protein